MFGIDDAIIAAGIGLGATALGGGLAYGASRESTKEQRKQRKLAEKMAKGSGCKGGTCGRKPSPQAAPQSSLQQQLSPQGQIPEVGGQGNVWTGYDASAQQLPRFNPEQQSAMSQLLGQGLQNTNPDFLEQRAQKQFYRDIVPTLAERFTSMGAGAQGSSDFRGSLSAAGSDLASQMQALRAQVGGQQLAYGLQPQFENIYNPERQGLLQSAASTLAPAATQLAGDLASPWVKKYSNWVLGGGNQDQQQQQQQQQQQPSYGQKTLADYTPINNNLANSYNPGNNYLNKATPGYTPINNNLNAGSQSYLDQLYKRK